MKFIIILTCSLFIGCVRAEPPTAHPNASSQSPPAVRSSVGSASVVRGGIRNIDFGNFTYDWYPPEYEVPSSGAKIILENGSMELSDPQIREPSRFVYTQTKYGDVTNDGAEEAIVTVCVFSSGTARIFIVFLYTLRNNVPTKLWAYETGDRWDYGYHDAYVKDGELVVEQYKPVISEYEGKKHNLSTSDTYVRHYYKWSGNSLKEVRSQETPVNSEDTNPWVMHKQ